MIKRFVLISAAACVAAVLIGCGSGSPTKSGDSKETPPAVNKTGAPGGPGVAPPPPPPPPLPGK